MPFYTTIVSTLIRSIYCFKFDHLIMFRRQILKNIVSGTFTRFLHQEYKVNVNGMNINTVQVGNGEKTLMLLPGTLGTAWTDFRPQLECLPKLLPNYKIIAWDPPGFGKSIPPSRNVGLDTFYNDAKFAVTTMRALSREKFSLMGWSSGAGTAIIIAGCFPQYVDRLILWGADAFLNEKDISGLEVMKDVANWSPAMREPFEQVYGEKRLKYLVPKVIGGIIDFYTMRNGDVCNTEAKMVKAPTFVIRGAKDLVWSEEHVPYLFENLPICKYHEFPDGKHNIHLRYPDEFNTMVAEFLLQNKKELKRIFKHEICLS